MKKILGLLFLLSFLFAQTTGKISGVVVDKEKKDALLDQRTFESF